MAGQNRLAGRTEADVEGGVEVQHEVAEAREEQRDAESPKKSIYIMECLMSVAAKRSRSEMEKAL